MKCSSRPHGGTCRCHVHARAVNVRGRVRVSVPGTLVAIPISCKLSETVQRREGMRGFLTRSLLNWFYAENAVIPLVDVRVDLFYAIP